MSFYPSSLISSLFFILQVPTSYDSNIIATRMLVNELERKYIKDKYVFYFKYTKLAE